MFKWNKLLLLVELWWDQILYLNEPCWTFRIRENKNREQNIFSIDNRKNLCEHGGLHPMIARKGNYIPGKLYNSMKETFIKNWESKSVLGLNSSKEIPKFTNHDISESNMRCDICIIELWHDMSKTFSYGRN